MKKHKPSKSLEDLNSKLRQIELQIPAPPFRREIPRGHADNKDSSIDGESISGDFEVKFYV